MDALSSSPPASPTHDSPECLAIVCEMESSFVKNEDEFSHHSAQDNQNGPATKSSLGAESSKGAKLGTETTANPEHENGSSNQDLVMADPVAIGSEASDNSNVMNTARKVSNIQDIEVLESVPVNGNASYEGSISDGQPTKVGSSHFLIEWRKVDALLKPIRASSRIKYISMSVGQTYIALGSSAGSLYIFNRDSLQYLQMAATNSTEGAIVHAAFSANDKVIAYATSKGSVVVVELQIDKRSKPERIRSTNLHRGAAVTALCWSPNGSQLFIGDDLGKVTVVNVPTSKPGDLLKVDTETIVCLDSPVVQLDSFENKLLISSTKAHFIANTSIHKFMQIGKTPRDGAYGGCFYHAQNLGSLVAYTGRPRSRMWEVSCDGEVLNTHQFKTLLDIAPVNIQLPGLEVDASQTNKASLGPQSVAFHSIRIICDRYLLALSSKGVYVLDPVEVKVILWTNDIKDFQTVALHKNDIYFLFNDNSIRQISFEPLYKFLTKLNSANTESRPLHEILITYRDELMQMSSRRQEIINIVNDVMDKATETDDEKCQKLTQLKCDLESKLQEATQTAESTKCQTGSGASSNVTVSGFSRMDSGIYIMKARNLSAGTDDLHDENDTLPGRILDHQKSTQSDDSRSHDTISIASSGSGDVDTTGGIMDSTFQGAKSKLVSLKNKLQQKMNGKKSEVDLGVSAQQETARDAGVGRYACTTIENSELEENSIALQNGLVSNPAESSVVGTECENVDECKTMSDGHQRGEDVKHVEKHISADFIPETPEVIVEDLDSLQDQIIGLHPNTNPTPFQYRVDNDSSESPQGHGVWMQRSKSSESLLSIDVKEGFAGSHSLSRRGSLTSTDVSISSGEMICGQTVLDAEPEISAQALPASIRVKGRKKKVSVINLDGDLTAHNSLLVKKKARKISDKVQGKLTRSHTSSEITAVGTTNITRVASEPLTLTSDPIEVPSGDSSLTLTESTSGDLGEVKEDQEGSSTLSNTLMTVKDRVGSGAWTLMQTLKAGAEKLGGSTGRGEALEVDPRSIGKRSRNTLIHRPRLLEAEFDGAVDEAVHSEDGLVDNSEVGGKAELEEEAGVGLEAALEVELTAYKRPVIDLSLLKQATDETIKKMSFSEGKCDENALYKWVVHLNHTLHQLRIAMATNKDADTDSSQGIMIDLSRAGDEEMSAIDSKDSDLQNISGDIYTIKEQRNSNGCIESGDDVPLTGCQATEAGSMGTGDAEMFHATQEIQHSGTPAQLVMDQPKSVSVGNQEQFHFTNCTYCSDPFLMDAELHCDVTKLATLCFRKRIFGNIRSWLKTEISSFNTDSIQKTAQEKIEEGSCWTEDAIAFTRSYFHCLDHSQVKESSEKLGGENKEFWDNRYKLWTGLLQCSLDYCEENENSAAPTNADRLENSLSLLTGATLHDKCLLALAQRLYLADPDRCVSFVAANETGVTPIDVLYLIRHSQQVFPPPDSDAHLRCYVIHYLGNRGTKASSQEALEVLCCDLEVRLAVIEALLHDPPPDVKLTCSCGYPRPQSHRAAWPSQNALDILLSIPSGDPDTLLDMTYSAGYWKGHLKLTSDPSILTSIILQLGDLELLKSQSNLFNTKAVWRMLLRSLKLQEFPSEDSTDITSVDEETAIRQKTLLQSNIQSFWKCLKCGDKLSVPVLCIDNGSELSDLEMTASDAQPSVLRSVDVSLTKENYIKEDDSRACIKPAPGNQRVVPISWESLAYLLISCTGTNEGLEMLKETEISEGRLSTSFFLGCVQRELLLTHIGAIEDCIVRALKDNLSNGRPALFIQVLAVQEMEKELEDLGFTVADPCYPRLVQKIQQSLVAMASIDSQWGIRVKLTSPCPKCQLRLNERISLSQPGVISFNCGHCFHLYCCSVSSCPLCLPLNPSSTKQDRVSSCDNS